MACNAELERFPIIVAINQETINYTLYLQNRENESVFKQIFLMSADDNLHSSGKNKFLL